VVDADDHVDLDALALGIEQHEAASYVWIRRADERDALRLEPLARRPAGRGSEPPQWLGLGRDEPVAGVFDPDPPTAAGRRDREVVERRGERVVARDHERNRSDPPEREIRDEAIDELVRLAGHG
jgi:hypothetical protein